MLLNLVRITETGRLTEKKVLFMAVDDKELDNMEDTQGSYSYIERDFEIERLGEVLVPRLG